MSGWCVMRGVNTTKICANRMVGSALVVSALLLSATSVQAMGASGKENADKPAAELAEGDMQAPSKPPAKPAGKAAATPLAQAPVGGGVPKSMIAPPPFSQAATSGDSAPVAPPAALPPTPAMPTSVGTAQPAPVAAPAAKPVAPAMAADGAAPLPSVATKPAMTPVATTQQAPPTTGPAPAPMTKPSAPAMAAGGVPPAAPQAAQPSMTPAQMPLAAGGQPSAATPVALEKPAEQPSDFSGRKADYYDNRAKEMLAEENKADGPGRLHPLQLAMPSHNVIVCEAGCGKEGVHVVSRTLKANVRPVIAPLSATMPTAGVVGRDRTLDCRGGCDRPANRMALGAPAAAAAPQVLNESSGRWMTTVTPEAPAAKAPVAQAPTAAPAAQPGKSAKTSREDWMARINRERAADKSADRAADILEPAQAE